VASYTGLAVGAITLLCGLILLLFSDTLVNKFVKPRITAAFVEAYPAYSLRIADMTYGVRRKSFRFESVALSAADSSFSGTIASLDVTGTSWVHLLWGGSLGPHDFDDAVVDAQTIELSFPRSRYELRCAELRASIADSTLIADVLNFHPAVGDEDFFARSKSRIARFTFTTRECRLTGVGFLAALNRRTCRARNVQVRDIGLDILINKDKPAARDTSSPLMPGEALSSMKERKQCDSIEIVKGSLKYGERFVPGSKPAAACRPSREAHYAPRERGRL
jgi:hypothetical protein